MIEAETKTDWRQIVFIASYPKSGNTWVRLFLDAYFLQELDINDMVTSLSDDNAGLYAIGDGSHTEELPIDLQHLTRPMALLRLVKTYNAANHGIPLFVKSHTAHMLANGVELFPFSLTKAMICIVRDPRDVLPSFSKHMGCDLDQGLEWMADKYKTLSSREGLMADFLSSWDANVKSFLNADTHNVRIFKYEDMRANPEQQFAEILRHSGVEPDPFKVRQALNMVDLEKLRKMEQKDGFVESSPNAKDQFFGKGKVGGWKDKLTDTQKYRIEKEFGRTMKRLGYIGNKKAATWH